MHKGFTLIELMIVVVILAIFTMIAIPNYQQYVARAYQAKAQSEMLMVAESLENYRGRQLNFAGFQAVHEAQHTAGVIYLPYEADETNYRYKIQLVDINTDKSLDQSVIGQGWKMLATPFQYGSAALRASPSYLLSSHKTKCATTALLTVTVKNCGDDHQGW